MLMTVCMCIHAGSLNSLSLEIVVAIIMCQLCYSTEICLPNIHHTSAFANLCTLMQQLISNSIKHMVVCCATLGTGVHVIYVGEQTCFFFIFLYTQEICSNLQTSTPIWLKFGTLVRHLGAIIFTNWVRICARSFEL